MRSRKSFEVENNQMLLLLVDVDWLAPHPDALRPILAFLGKLTALDLSMPFRAYDVGNFKLKWRKKKVKWCSITD